MTMTENPINLQTGVKRPRTFTEFRGRFDSGDDVAATGEGVGIVPGSGADIEDSRRLHRQEMEYVTVHLFKGQPRQEQG